MYTIKEFANMIGVTPQTLRNKHKSGVIIPTLINPSNSYRMYSDELAYIYDDSRSVMIYDVDGDNNNGLLDDFKDSLYNSNIKYECFTSNKEYEDPVHNKAIFNLLKRVSQGTTYTIVYDENKIQNKDLEFIRFCINSCFSYVQVKKISDFSLELKDLEDGGCE